MLAALARWARQEPGLRPEVAYSPLNRKDPIHASLRRGRWRPAVRRESWEGLPAHAVGRVFRAIEALHHCGNRQAWQRLLDGYDLHQVVCGYALTGLPQALCEKQYVIWVATSMDGDKQARRQLGRPLYRWLQRLQAGRLRRLERLVLERAAWVLALSPHTRDELLERGARADRISVLRCPIELGSFVPAPTPPERATVLWSGRLNDPRKNTGLLLRAFARMAPRLPEARLLLVGEADAAEIDRAVAGLGLSGRVEFAGPRPLAEMPAVYRRATVFAIPSDQEGLGIVGLEAMACGLPVVSTRCGGPQAFVIPGQTGILVNLNDEAQMADALYALLSDPATCQRMGQQARRLVEREYSPDHFAEQLREVYSTVWPHGVTARRQPAAAPSSTM
jgi:glycosyltransferase involved in cell wall biosynthesis